MLVKDTITTTKYGEIKICELKKTSVFTVEVICDNCKEIYTTQLMTYRSRNERLGKDYCSNCADHRGKMIISLHVKDTIRSKIRKWVEDSLSETGYRCILTGQETKTVHHVYEYSYLFRESLKELGWENKRSDKDFTQEEIDLLGEVCLRKHYEYGLGACITEELHKLFHHLYGHQDIMVEQFEEFKKLYTVFVEVQCTEELRQQTEAIADSLGESLSDYVRKAVEQRNNMEKVKACFGTKSEKKTVQEVISEPIVRKEISNQAMEKWDNPGDKEKFESIWGPARDETPKQQFTTEQLKELERASGKPDKEFKTFFKEGKK